VEADNNWDSLVGEAYEMTGEKLGFIGIGIMGKSMAMNLKKAGYEVYVFDVNEKALEEVKKHGIITCSSCRDVALAVDDTIIIMVRTTEQARNVIFGSEGIVSSGREALNIILTSTVRPSVAKELGEGISKLRYKMINAPVSGGDMGAAKGTLTLMVSGDEELYVKATPIFNAIGKKVFYLGAKQESGQGAKLANNIMLGINMLGCIEGVRFAERMGIPEKTFVQLVSVSTGNSFVIQNWEWFKALWEKEYTRECQLATMYKDLLEVIKEGSVSLPITSLASQLFLSKEKS
jgi:3-hydroxyisobutyrate dehydrogenase-like beta-hydroxyacid dehydrogenase